MELVVVILIVGIIAGVGWPSLEGWNCRQSLRNDFERFNLYMSEVKSESVSSNQPTLVNVVISNGEAVLSSFVLDNNSCSFTDALSIEQQIPKLTLPTDTKVSALGINHQCFYPDGRAEANSWEFKKTCAGKKYLYKNQFFGATGLYEKQQYNYTTKAWNDI